MRKELMKRLKEDLSLLKTAEVKHLLLCENFSPYIPYVFVSLFLRLPVTLFIIVKSLYEIDWGVSNTVPSIYQNDKDKN